MADAKKIRKELLATGMFLDGENKVRGDLVELDPDQAARLESAGVVAEVGHLDKLRKEREAAEQAATEREVEAVRLSDERAHRQLAHDADRLATPAAAAAPSDGPRTTRRGR